MIKPSSCNATQAPEQSSGHKQLPLGRAAGLEGLAVHKVAFMSEVVVEGGVNGGELLKALHLPEREHRPLSSSEWQMRVLHPAGGPAA